MNTFIEDAAKIIADNISRSVLTFWARKESGAALTGDHTVAFCVHLRSQLSSLPDYKPSGNFLKFVQDYLSLHPDGGSVRDFSNQLATFMRDGIEGRI